MAISIVDLTPTEVASALATEEGHFADLKAIEIAPANLTKTTSAFANTDAGELFVIQRLRRGVLC
jgi:ATP-dependent DNA helicase RecG